MRQVFGVSKLQNQLSGLKQDSSIKKMQSENRSNMKKLDTKSIIYEEEEQHQIFGKNYKLEDYEFTNLYEATKQLVKLNIEPIVDEKEFAADLIMRYGLVEENQREIVEEVSRTNITSQQQECIEEMQVD